MHQDSWVSIYFSVLILLFFRLENYINLARDNLGLEILPSNTFKSFIFSLTKLDKSDPERKFLCEISLTETEGGKQKYSGRNFGLGSSAQLKVSKVYFTITPNVIV